MTGQGRAYLVLKRLKVLDDVLVLQLLHGLDLSAQLIG